MTSPTAAPETRPRWLLWVLVVGAIVALLAAYAYGPGQDEDGTDGARGDGSTSPAASDAPASDPPVSTPGGSGNGPGDTTTSAPATPPSTTAPTPPAPPPSTAAPPPPPTTAAVPPPPPAPSPARVVVTSCRTGDGRVVAMGTVENQGRNPESYRVHVYVLDRSGTTLLDVATEVRRVAPGSTRSFTIREPGDAAILSRAAGCKRDGGAEAI